MSIAATVPKPAHVPSCLQGKPPVMRADIEKGTALGKVFQNPLANVRLRVLHIGGQHSWMHPKEFAANLSRERRPWNRRKPPPLCAQLQPAVKPRQRPFQSAIKVDPHVDLVPAVPSLPRARGAEIAGASSLNRRRPRMFAFR